MTVRIVDPNPDPEVVKNVVCKHCGVKLEYVPNDVKSRHGTDIGGGPDGQEWVDCPNCSQKAVIRSW